MLNYYIVPWNYTSKSGYVKCREDKENQFNDILINYFYVEEVMNEDNTILKCFKFCYFNNNKVVIITMQLWEFYKY